MTQRPASRLRLRCGAALLLALMGGLSGCAGLEGAPPPWYRPGLGSHVPMERYHVPDDGHRDRLAALPPMAG
ncbi:hypothetical protein JYK14_04105 [Siccirubricoccus sp. KC 17139]|uniref:Uncharacterized protein n=1 Tax=Siccirubricoccus soli TaxID=2899147 RepID=A0ABT1D0B8_9PROT|nr:hypothetical protein [Siccirubricoccus soli]MCO6415359.1 hypothetical protein [Siccirubricoccus soli]MCP2681491.1 hypothetical protein [Siccirubricoccus soli]